jgi:signal peptidase
MLGVANAVVCMIVAVVAALALVLAVGTHFAPRSLTVAGHPLLNVMSGSMAPTIRTGDLVVDRHVSATEAQHLAVGQIITFTPQAGVTATITHRIDRVVQTDGGVGYVTKGDANNAADSDVVNAAQVVGVYDFKISRGAYVVSALRKPLTLGLLLAAPALWLLSGWFFALARRVES